jgi:dipeptidyl aminopeptidase/acylaminoacyl peptidase
VVDRDGGNLRDLTPFDGVRASVIDDLTDNPGEMLIGLNKRNPQVFDVYRINVTSGEMKLVAENPGNIMGWVTDHEGRIRIAITSDGVNSSLLYRDTEDQPFKPLLTTTFKETLAPLFFTFDNKNIYALSNLNRDKTAVVEFDLGAVKEKKVIFQHPEVDVSNMSYSQKRKVLTAISWTTWKREYKILDPRFETIYTTLKQKLPGTDLAVSSTDLDETKFVVTAYSDRVPSRIYLYENENKKLTRLGDPYPWLDENKLAEMKPIQYQSRDGLTIHGYLTLPLGKEPANLPVVVNPHGGPWHRDSWGYNPEVQFLANRGYAVLQMNFRGSTGYGRSFWEASFKQWGKTMQDDITDGVKWLIGQGIADPKRIAIYGGSYGGYATLAGITFTPELYACAVDYVGVSNLFTFMKTIPPYWKPLLEMMYEMVGDPEKDKELMKSASPVFHVDKIRCPLFVAQGAKDPRVNIDESDQIVEALKKRGINVEYMVKENEGHGFRNEENRFDFYGAMEKFLARHLAPEK